MAEQTGIEPATSGVTGRHPRPARPLLLTFGDTAVGEVTDHIIANYIIAVKSKIQGNNFKKKESSVSTGRGEIELTKAEY